MTTVPTRTSWTDIPLTVRRAVEQLLDGPVARTSSQAAGWSPGSADRVVTATGRRAFVKTIARGRNADGWELHRREAVVVAALPAQVQAPRLLGAVDLHAEGDAWTALVLEDVPGHHPRDGEDTTAVLDALDTLPRATGTLAALPRAADDLRTAFGAWARMGAIGLPEVIPAHLHPHVARFAELERDAAARVDGEHLVHLDCRADNLLVDDAGVVWVVDWPWAGVGAHWLDPLTYLLDALVRGEDVDVEHHLATHRVFHGLSGETVDAVLAALAGMFLEKAAQPAPPSMPTIRAFQRREGLAAAEWLLRRHA